MTKEIKCQRCSYIWNYTGKRLYTSCPKCMTMVKALKYDEFVKYHNIEE